MKQMTVSPSGRSFLSAELLSDHDPAFLKVSESLGEKGRRHSRDSALKVIESSGAQKELAKDQHRPLFTNDLARLRHRAELSVTRHLSTSARFL